MMSKWPRRLLGLGLCAVSAALQAQTPQQPEPGAAQRLDRERLERYLQEQRAREAPPAKPEITLPPAPAVPQAVDVPNIPVKGFRVGTSEILTEAEIRGVLAPLEGRTVSLKDLFDAVAALNKLYADRHMPTARAFLPPQEIQDGVVEIRLVEARVGAIKVEGLAQQDPAFVTERLRLAPGQLMSVDTRRTSTASTACTTPSCGPASRPAASSAPPTCRSRPPSPSACASPPSSTTRARTPWARGAWG